MSDGLSNDIILVNFSLGLLSCRELWCDCLPRHSTRHYSSRRFLYFCRVDVIVGDGCVSGLHIYVTGSLSSVLMVDKSYPNP